MSLSLNADQFAQWLAVAYAAACFGVVAILALLYRQGKQPAPVLRWQVERDASGRRLKERV
jgi:hypothetical protein